MKISSAGLLTAGTKGASPDFKIHTSAMVIDPEHENIVRMIGSSTERDLHGDTMALSALTDMTKVEPGVTVWRNHSYDVPNDLFGSLMESPSLALKDGIADLHIISDVEMDNPEAVQTLKLVKNGRKLGCSIGCMVLECEIDEENDDGHSWWPPIIITSVQVLEFSVVGIPANQRCWVEPATKGLFERMASEGRGDAALKLAPAVKGLYPRAYDEYLKTISNEALRRDLERIEVKEAPKSRVEWMPNERVFAMSTKGVYKPMERGEVTELLGKSYGGFTAKPPKESQEEVVEAFEEGDTLAIKGASGKTSWPLADEDTAWSNSEAHKRIMEKFGGDDPDWAKVKTVHFWYDPEKDDIWGGYKLLFCDVIGGDVKAVPKAIYACAGAVQGARGGLDIPDSDVPAVKKKIEAYYRKLDKKAPWEEEEDKEEAAEPEKQADAEEQKVTLLTNNASGSTEVAAEVPVISKEVLDGIAEAEERCDREHEIPLATLDKGRFSSEQEETITTDGTGTFIRSTSLLDVQLFNALAARLGQPVITLDEQGQIQAPKAEDTVSREFIEEAIAKALEFLDITKSGSEFSSKNRKALQDIHDGIVEMCKGQFHPCEEMAANDNDGGEDGDDGKDKPDGDGDEDGKEKSVPVLDIKAEIAPLQAQITALIDTLASHGLDPKTLKDLQGQSQALQSQLKDAHGQIKEVKEGIAKLKDLPLGQPTRLSRSVRTGEEVAHYQDFAQLSVLAMGDNERRWTLEEALKETIVYSRSLPGGDNLNYRKWPDGIGGSVKGGVRPDLTGDQRKFMHPMEQLAYNDGREASVPCYDDPCGIRA